MSTCKGRDSWGHGRQGRGQGRGGHSVVLADLSSSQCHLGVLGLAELRQLIEDGRQLICQCGVTAA